MNDEVSGSEIGEAKMESPGEIGEKEERSEVRGEEARPSDESDKKELGPEERSVLDRIEEDGDQEEVLADIAKKIEKASPDEKTASNEEGDQSPVDESPTDDQETPELREMLQDPEFQKELQSLIETYVRDLEEFQRKIDELKREKPNLLKMILKFIADMGSSISKE